VRERYEGVTPHAPVDNAQHSYAME